MWLRTASSLHTRSLLLMEAGAAPGRVSIQLGNRWACEALQNPRVRAPGHGPLASRSLAQGPVGPLVKGVLQHVWHLHG